MAPRVRLLITASLALVMAIVVAVLKWPAPAPADGPDGAKKPPRPGQASAGKSELPPPERLTMLVIGTDSRPDDPGRTDTIMLATVDTGSGEISLLSIPRDTWVHVRGHGWTKINHAYAVAPDDSRPQAVAETVSGLLGVPVEHYIVVHMDGFEQVVDLLGGVVIDVEKDMYYYDPQDTPPLLIDLAAGRQRLSGSDALNYVRFRSDDRADWGRMERQQTFLRALAKEALQLRNVTKMGVLAKAFKAAVEMDLGEGDLMRLGLSYRKFNLDDMETNIIGGYDRLIGGIYFMEPDLASARTLAHRQIYGQEPPASVLAEAAADFARARSVIESEIARFEELAEAEDDGDEPSSPDDADNGELDAPEAGGSEASGDDPAPETPGQPGGGTGSADSAQDEAGEGES